MIAARLDGLRSAGTPRRVGPDGRLPDDLLAFRIFACRKEDPVPGRLRSVFHGAFDDPTAPPGAERRQSCEHRVIVTLLAD